ncbi:Kinesin-like protein unc-104 [Diplonema papillatum]|nr:Kinesin-like protein unc-104 [Diplonema papillatum]
MEEENSPLGGSFGTDPTHASGKSAAKPRPKGRAQAPPSLAHASRRRSSGGNSDTGFSDSRRFAPSLREFDDLESPGHDLHRKPSAGLHSRSISPNASPRVYRRSSGAGVGGHAVGLGANIASPLNAATETSNVRVMVRVRPFGQKEIDEVTQAGGYLQSVIDMPRKDQVLLLDHANEYAVLQGFNFDEVYWSCTQQKSNVDFGDQVKVFESTGMPALAAAWEGINSCIFAYGQTGSGKTHTMMGDPSQIANPEGCDEKDLGVIPRLCRDMFAQLEQKSLTAAQHGLRRTADVRVRFYEIYNEKVRDLLGKVCDGPELRFTYAGTKDVTKLNPEDLKIREHPTEGPYVEGISIHQPKSYEDIIALINAGNQERSVATTNLNDRSSRSHAIFRVTVTQTTFYDQERVGIGGPKTTTHQRRANINLVDLAGSENVKRSGASGSTLIEAQKINLSLTTLRRVIDALIENKSQKNVPYRDSTLTWLLREDLGGNSKTYMLATVSPHHTNAHESHRTLEYAMRARAIVNSVRVNEDETAKMIADLEKKIFESAQQMSKGVSEAERIDLEQQMAEAEKARTEIESRLLDAANEASKYKEQLEQEKEKNMAFAFRHALMLRAAKARLTKAETMHMGDSKELASIRETMKAIGHHNIEEFAQILTSERSKVETLVQQKLELQKQKDSLELEHRALHQSNSQPVTKRETGDEEDTVRPEC